MSTQQLKILAQQATPWPWKWFTSNSHNRLSSVASGKDGDVISAFKAADGAACVSISQDDMAFIEAAHPGAVLELIERLETAERERDELRAEIARRDAAAGEPVAWQYRYNDGKVGDWHTVDSESECNHLPCYERRPIYTAGKPAVLPPEKIIEIMQDAWNEFCDDTGCYPDDFEYQNEKLFFDAGRWAMLVAERISSLGAQ